MRTVLIWHHSKVRQIIWRGLFFESQDILPALVPFLKISITDAEKDMHWNTENVVENRTQTLTLLGSLVLLKPPGFPLNFIYKLKSQHIVLMYSQWPETDIWCHGNWGNVLTNNINLQLFLELCRERTMKKVTFVLFIGFLCLLPILIEAKRNQQEPIVKSENKKILQAISIHMPGRCRKGYALNRGKCRRKPNNFKFNPFIFGFA